VKRGRRNEKKNALPSQDLGKKGTFVRADSGKKGKTAYQKRKFSCRTKAVIAICRRKHCMEACGGRLPLQGGAFRGDSKIFSE